MVDRPESPLDLLPVSESASAAAPFIYFDGSPNYGNSNGIVSVTLEAIRHTMGNNGSVIHDRVIVANLRCSPLVARQLRDALTLALDIPTQRGSENTN